MLEVQFSQTLSISLTGLRYTATTSCKYKERNLNDNVTISNIYQKITTLRIHARVKKIILSKVRKT